MATIGETIKWIRKERKMTQKDFASKIGLSRSYLGDLENNRKSPSADTITKLSKSLGVSEAYLFTGKEVRDLVGNRLPEGLMLYDYEFIGHYKKKLKDSPVRVIYSYIKISKDDTSFYCGIRSSVVLGSVDLSMRNATITILSENLEEDEFYNSATLSKKFDNETIENMPFVNCDDYLNIASLGNKDFRTTFLNDSMDKILNILRQDKEMPFDDIDFNGNFHYFKRGTTKTISLIIGR